MPNKVFFIVNPCSANGSTRRWWPSVLPQLDQAGFDYAWACTTGPYTAPAQAAEAVQAGFTTIVAVGGDGTAYEVLNGLMSNDRQPNLAVWPRGTGCDLLRVLGLPRSEAGMINVLKKGRTRNIDAGQAFFIDHNGQQTVRYWLNVAEVGLGGATVARVNRTSKALGGFLSFLRGALATIAVYRNKHLRIILDDQQETEGDFALVACGNGQYFGGGMRICPQAVIDDGWLDVVAVEGISKPDLIMNLPRVYRGTHLSHPCIWQRRVKKIRFESRDQVLVNLDGEQPGIVSAEFSIIPKAVKILV